MSMYRQILIWLLLLVAGAVLLSALGKLAFAPGQILGQTVFLLLWCWLLNSLLARLVKTKTNFESPLITALILSLLIGPVGLANWLVLLVAGAAAILSKYLLVFNHSHVFNPAAFGAIAIGVGMGMPASWWVGNSWLFPFILIGGLWVIWHIRRIQLVAIFLAVFLALLSWQGGWPGWDIFISSPLLFFCFVMLVEPLTSPQTPSRRLWFGAIVAIGLVTIGRFFPALPYGTELALLVGNIFGRIIEFNFRQNLILIKKETIASGVTSFWFSPAQPFNFLPGQFLEYTLAHAWPDQRGERRYFTIASSPTEKSVLLTTRFSEPGSSFKRALQDLVVGESIIASKLGGDFVLPTDSKQKLVFIAGGIGITPFRSILKYLLDSDQTRDVILLYGARSEADLVFMEIFRPAEAKFGLRIVTAVGEQKIDLNFIRQQVPDLAERLCYVSGPEPMVKNIEKTLARLGMGRRQVKHDYFPGY